MSLIPAIRNFFTMQPSPIPADPDRLRAYVTGPAAVDKGEQYFGIPNEDYKPGEYRNYPATSNGVYACVNVRAKALASLPLKIYSLNAAGDRTEITNGQLWLLLRKVNPYWTWARLAEMTEQSLGVWGECFWFMSLKGGKPAEVWWAPADRVTVHPDPVNYVSHFVYEWNGQKIPFSREETVWIRYANVANEYSGLSPLAAARLAADTASAAMHSNMNVFRNGSQIAGMVVPDKGMAFSEEQAEQLKNDMDKRFKGVDKAHRLGVLRTAVDIKSVTLAPKDAEFLGTLNWSLEDIARAYSVPIDKIGGKRTYQNVEESEKVFWHDCMLPEARFIAAELTEQLLPAFGENLIAEFDTSDIDVLHEAEQDRWTRIKEQIVTGYDSINNIRKEEGLDPVPWGDVWWAQSSQIPIDSNEKPEPVMPALAPGPQDENEDTDDEPPTEDAPDRAGTSQHSRMIAYGSDEHQRLWERYVLQSEPYEQRIATKAKELFRTQQDAIAQSVRSERRKRDIADLADDPFDKPKWIRRFREEMRPVLTLVAQDAARAAYNELGLTTAFNVVDLNISNAMMRQAQQFAESVNDTTWDTLRKSLKDGIEAGEAVDDLAGRVESVMADRIRSSGTTIARTETTRASTTGTHAGWKASGVVSHVQWLAALDERTRETHISAHGQTVPLGEDFHVGGCSGPGPGEIDCARESIQCRCTTIAILDVEGFVNA